MAIMEGDLGSNITYIGDYYYSDSVIVVVKFFNLFSKKSEAR